MTQNSSPTSYPEADIERQRDYYRRTSQKFDEMHLLGAEHVTACELLVAFLSPRHPNCSILDIGAGTGRFYRFLRDRSLGHHFDVSGLEPSDAQREVAYANGVPRDKHFAGDACSIAKADDAFDFCTEFGVLHHIKNYETAVREMCRVARRGVYLSDSNNVGQGTYPARLTKYALKSIGLWPIANYINTGGKGYIYSEGDGVFYSFSVFDTVSTLQEKFDKIHIWSTQPTASRNLVLGCNHLAILAYN